MKAKAPSRPEPEPAFADPKHRPEAEELQAALGAAAPDVDEMLAQVRQVAPAMTMEWQYYRRAGWYQTYSLKERRLVYVAAKRDGVRVSMLLGDKAIAALRAGPHGARLEKLLVKAKRYPEGTGFVFEQGKFNPKLIAAMVAAKLGK